MANSVGSRPMQLDTVTASPLLTSWVDIGALEYSGYNLNTDNAVLVDFNNRVIWAPTGRNDLSPVHVTSIQKVLGLRLSSITAGIIRVYVK